MRQIKVEKDINGIKGLAVITPAVHGDERGYFMETYNRDDFREAGLFDADGKEYNFVQDNESSSRKGVLRGLHLQTKFAQDKIVRVTRGSVYDVAVDLRIGSDTFGKWYGIELTEKNKKQFLIPRNVAHGFLVLSDYAEFCYKVTDFFHPEYECGIMWNDPDLNVQWPLDGIDEIILSDKDKGNLSFCEFLKTWK